MQQKRRIYIAGPMRGVPYYNFAEFDKARDLLISEGWGVVSPADMDRCAGFDALKCAPDTDWTKVPEGFSFDDAVRRDLEAVQTCDAIYLLCGWRDSKGARAERCVAEWKGLLLVYQDEREYVRRMGVASEPVKVEKTPAQIPPVPIPVLMPTDAADRKRTPSTQGSWPTSQTRSSACPASRS
jgi:hypothetical protein